MQREGVPTGAAGESLEGEQGLNEAQVKAASSLSQPGSALG